MEFTQTLFPQAQVSERRDSLMPLTTTTDFSNGPMPSPLSRISPPSSGTSSPSSPDSGPFTPSTAALPYSFMPSMPPQDFEHLGPLDPIDPSLSQPTSDFDSQAELQNQDFSQFSWAWPDSNAPAMLDNNWDISSIPSALLGEQPGMGGKMSMMPGHELDGDMCGTGLDFGQDFSQALESSWSGSGDPTLLGSYDEYMAGTAFA